ncbi:hypothetical protein D5R95_00405, partial [Methanosalsum natronophilum]
MIDYKAIKEKNIQRYGTEIGKIGKLLLAYLYSDRSHFLYELLQNAEDACERVHSQGEERNFSVSFTLFPDRLEFRHNGMPFNERDVEGICGISEDTKSEYERQIGKFGIGFKSVFAYTKSPEIYSNEKAFRIDNYVWPENITPREDVSEGETLIVIPFHTIEFEETVTPEMAYREIGDKLSKLGLKTILFTRNISEIVWKTGERSGKYSKQIQTLNGYRKITISSEDGHPKKWLVFEKTVSPEEKDAIVEVAYFLTTDENEKTHIKATSNSELVVYFPTGKETHLKFLIQGPYHTTPTREDIRKNDSWNKQLILTTGELVSESLEIIKREGFLDIECLSVMPLDDTPFTTDSGQIFYPIFQQVEEALKTKELLPTSNGKHTTKEKAAIARANELIGLLSSEQLMELFNRTNWLDSRIKQTSSRWRELWEYLTKHIEVEEIRPEHFATKVTKSFLIEQSDEWIITFYGALLKWESLWNRDTIVDESDFKTYNSLRVKPIIRLEDENGSHVHVLPFDKNNKPNAFIPPTDEKLRKNITGYFNNRVKSTILNNEKSKEFLNKLGLREPDAISAIYEYILPKYRPHNKDWEPEEENELNIIPLDENTTDLERIVKALKKFSNDSRNNELISDLLKTEFLYCRNMGTGERYYCSPTETIYLDSAYTEDKAVDIFFEGNKDIWVLEKNYNNILDVTTLKRLGCKSNIDISYEKPRWGGHITINSFHGCHERGVDGFDPRCQIEGLEWAIKNITFEKSLILWGILKDHYRQIKGIVERGTRQDYSNAKRVPKYSEMGNYLTDRSWLYIEGDEENPYKPKDIMLSALHSDYSCPEIKSIAEQLEFQTPIKEELKEKMSEEEWELHEVISNASRYGLKDELVAFIKKRIESEQMKSVDKSPSQIVMDLEEALTTVNGDVVAEEDDGNQVVPSLTPEEEEEIEKVHGEEIPKILKKIKLKTNVIATTKSTSVGTIDVAQFLISEYDGHCQICNVRLFSG